MTFVKKKIIPQKDGHCLSFCQIWHRQISIIHMQISPIIFPRHFHCFSKQDSHHPINMQSTGVNGKVHHEETRDYQRNGEKFINLNDLTSLVVNFRIMIFIHSNKTLTQFMKEVVDTFFLGNILIFFNDSHNRHMFNLSQYYARRSEDQNAVIK